MKFLLSTFIFSLLSGSTFAANISLTGNFTQDDNVQLIPFSVASSSLVTLRTYSYAGGTNAAGTTIAEGGFDTYLALFNSAGLLIAENDDGIGVPVSSVTGLALDALIQTTLAAGSYTLALTEFDNFANGPNLSNGFLEMGAGNYTGAFGCTNGSFCDIAANNRTSFYAVDLLNVSTPPTTVPEPSAVFLCGSGLALAAAFVSRKRRLGN